VSLTFITRPMSMAISWNLVAVAAGEIVALVTASARLRTVSVNISRTSTSADRRA